MAKFHDMRSSHACNRRRRVVIVDGVKRMNEFKPPAPPSAVTLDDVLTSFRGCTPVFDALGDRFRQDIVMLLARDERLNVKQIAERIALSRPAISHHLKVLRQAGLIGLERVSRENFYSLTLDSALANIRRLVEQAEISCL
jgi:DNA-binding transcriptional ArsR family regulator